MDNEDLPPGWVWATLADVCEVNPATDTSHLSEDDEVAFVPMAAVAALSNQVDISRRRKLHEVSSGIPLMPVTPVLPDNINGNST
jgi:hypothetical protein